MKKIFRAFLLMLILLNVCCINGIAAGPLDGKVVDGSLLTSEESASDEKPLVEISNDLLIPFGTYLSTGISEIKNKGNGIVYISGNTSCYRDSDKVQVFLYLERLENGGWSTYKTHSKIGYDTYAVSVGVSFSVSKGYYYRVRGLHTAQKGSTVESCTTCTSAIYIG